MKGHDSPLYPQYPSLYPPFQLIHTPAAASQSRGFVGLRRILSESDQICRTVHTVNPADAISQKRASHRPKERGNESPRAQRSQTSRIHLVASPQGAGKRIIKSPEPHNCPNPLHPHRPKERGNESPRAQRSLTSQIHLVASPQGAGKCIIKDPEPPHLFQSATM